MKGARSGAHGTDQVSVRMLPTEAAAMGLSETFRRLGCWATGLALLISLVGFGPAMAQAYDNPDLLPDHPTPVIDLAKALSDGQRACAGTHGRCDSVVVEHNGDAIAPSEFASRGLAAGDRLEIVKIVAGG